MKLKHHLLSMITLIAFYLFNPTLIEAQVLDYNHFMATQNVRFRVFLQEENTEEPIGYASVYLTNPKDSTIAYFTLTDEKGEAIINDIVPGIYEISAEMIGYLPFKIKKELKGWEVNLGTISMKEDKKLLKASRVSATGNAIMVKGDTLIYNASSFKVNDNAMLEDLLKKMPGMKVDSNGNVTVGGETVDRITVGGRTFFLNDPTMAVKNLPAKIVEKISIIDKEKEEAAFTGVKKKDSKEKVMDVGLKEEYKNGWFGNASAEGGSTIMPKNDNPLLDNARGLFSARALVAAYSDKDQVTVLGNGKNVENGSYYIYRGSFNSDEDDFYSRDGQITGAQGGANYNTERIKNFETNVSANYDYSHKISKELSSRTSYVPDGENLLTDSWYDGTGSDHNARINLELKRKENDRFMFSFRPDFSFNRSIRNISNESQTNEAEKMMNRNTSFKNSLSQKYTTSGVLRLGIKKLGKERRALSLFANVNYWNSTGNSTELTKTIYESSQEIRDLKYDNRKSSLYTDVALTYVEPIGESWSIVATFVSKHKSMHSDHSAFNRNDDSPNTYYSSLSDQKYLSFGEEVVAQYAKGYNNLTFGLKVTEQQNRVFTRKQDMDNTIGENEWITNWAPQIDYSFSKNNINLGINSRGWTSSPYGTDIIPVLDIMNPTHITTGNIFLKPQFTYYNDIRLRFNDPKKMIFVSLNASAGITTNQKVYASWFDANGVRYAIPVNSKKNGHYEYMYINGSFPLDKKKNLKLDIGLNFDIHNSFSYQAKSVLKGLDKDNFDYAAEMEKFWGNRNGDRFYSGESGFEESHTTSITIGADLFLSYTLDNFEIEAFGYASNNIDKYSLDPKANMKTWDFTVGGTISWSHEKGWDIESSCYYNFYRGYTEGYGKPETIWDVSLSKRIKAFTIILRGSDLLNQKRNLRRIATSGFIQDTYRNVIGRHVMIGLAFNFGKANAQSNNKAQNAMYQIAY